MKRDYLFDFLYDLDEETSVTVYVTDVDFGSPGQTWGPPERCYPPEPAEICWHAVNEDGKEPALTNSQIEAIEELAWEKAQDLQEEPDYDY